MQKVFNIEFQICLVELGRVSPTNQCYEVFSIELPSCLVELRHVSPTNHVDVF